MTKTKAQATQLIDELATGVDALESLMPPWESNWWLKGDPADAADKLDRLEQEVEVLGRLGKSLEDGVTLNDATATAATARRAVAELYHLIKSISGMGYVERSGILLEVVGHAEVAVSTDIGKVQDFLEDVIEQVLDDAWDSLEAAIKRETAIAGIEQDSDVVNADGQVHLSSASGASQAFVSVEKLEAVSARGWCEEFAPDAADVITGAIKTLDDPEEATECLGKADRSVFGNAVLLRSVVAVILGHLHQPGVFDAYESGLATAQELVDDARSELEDAEVGVGTVVDALEEACSELLRVARVAAARCTALLALEHGLRHLSEDR